MTCMRFLLSLKTKTRYFQSIKNKNSLSHASIFSHPNQILPNPKSPIVLTRAQQQLFRSLSTNNSSLLLKNSSVAPLKHDGHYLDIFLFVQNTNNYDKILEIINTNTYNQHLKKKKKKPIWVYHMRYIYIYIWLSLQHLVSGQSIRITQ